jgi:hypothetical protein
MPFINGGGPAFYPPIDQSYVQAPQYVLPAQPQSFIPVQPGVSGGGAMSPMQVPIAAPVAYPTAGGGTPYQDPWLAQAPLQQPAYYPQQALPMAYVPQPQYAPAQYLPQQAPQLLPQQQMVPQQPQLVPQQSYAQPPIAAPQSFAPQSAPVAAPTPAPAAAPFATPAPAQATAGAQALGGGQVPLDQSAAIAGLQQAVASLTQLVTALAQQIAMRQQSPVNGGGPTAPVTGGGATDDCCGGGAGGGGGGASAAVSGGGAVPSSPSGSSGIDPGTGTELPPIPSTNGPAPSSAAPAPSPAPADLPPVPPASGPAGGSPQFDAAPLKIKGAPISPEQRENIKQVLQVGKEMGANPKVLKAAIATIIQESNAQNLNYGDRDSQGLFQQRPSQGWGSVAEVRDPKHAARKFFEQAIPNDQKNPGQSVTQLAQSVQRSGLPDAYAKWEPEADAAVVAFG